MERPIRRQPDRLAGGDRLGQARPCLGGVCAGSCRKGVVATDRWRLLDDHVRVGSTETERTHACRTRLPARRPRPRLDRDLQRHVLPRDVGRRRVEVEMGRNPLVFEG